MVTTSRMVRTAAVTRLGNLGAADLDECGGVGVVDLPAHDLGSEDVRIAVAYAGICGSDPHVAEGYFGDALPVGLGHEISGVVTELGPAATRNGLNVGDRVAGNFLRFCGTCRACRDGRQQFCPIRGSTTGPAWSRRSCGTSRRSSCRPTM